MSPAPGRARPRVHRVLNGAVALAILLVAAAAGAQEPATALGVQERAASRVQPSGEEEAVTPRGAFLRSLVIPGWGHAAVGAHGRGGAYFLLQASSLWMVHQSSALRGAARRLQEMEIAAVEGRLRSEGVTDPTEIRQALEQDPGVAERAELVESRRRQVEDWTALSVFLVLLIGADAFVSAHLADFPEPLSVRVNSAAPFGRVELGVSLPGRLPFGL